MRFTGSAAAWVCAALLLLIFLFGTGVVQR